MGSTPPTRDSDSPSARSNVPSSSRKASLGSSTPLHASVCKRWYRTDSLAERLREERVQRVIEPMLAGELPDLLPPDDVRYAVDLGLVRRRNGGIEIANPIYAEIIPTTLAEARTRADEARTPGGREALVVRG